MTEGNPELSVVEVAKLTGKSARVIHRYCKDGVIFPNARKTGPYENSAWVVPKSDVDAFIEKYPPVRKE